MDRRTLLRSGAMVGAAALAGCSSALGSGDSLPDDARRRVSIEQPPPIPSDAPVEVSIEVDDPWVTPTSTATLEATVANDGERPDRFGPPIRSESSDEIGPAGILLYPVSPSHTPPADYAPPCLEGGPDRQYVRTHDGEVAEYLVYRFGTELAPGESTTETAIVVDDPTEPGCVPPGEYTFSDTYGYSPSDDDVHIMFEVHWTLGIEDVSG